MNPHADILFTLIDHEINYTAKEITDRVFSAYPDLPWTAEQRKQLQPLVREELETMIQGVLGLFDNIGGALPDGTPGYKISAASDDADVGDDYAEDNADMNDDYTGDYADIRDGNLDYADMWLAYLGSKSNKQS